MTNNEKTYPHLPQATVERACEAERVRLKKFALPQTEYQSYVERCKEIETQEAEQKGRA